MKIGFFDSGVGGLRVMERVREELPEYDYVFFGDTKNVPYGDRTEEEIYALTKDAIQHLFDAHSAQLVVVACNTASAESLRRLQDRFVATKYPDRRVLGVIIPTVEEVVDAHVSKPLLIGTTRTISSHKFETEIAKLGAPIALSTHATPELVPLIEVGRLEEACAVLTPLLENHSQRGGDSVILGCTHYTTLTASLRAAFGDRLRFFSQDEIIPKKLKEYLDRHPEIEKTLSRNGTREILWSSAPGEMSI